MPPEIRRNQSLLWAPPKVDTEAPLVGLLTERHPLRRYSEELETRRREVSGEVCSERDCATHSLARVQTEEPAKSG
ncbi:hypothetical protein QN219_14145 [Sinorhizobium sp. 7-81]|uniref:hypothetical protein n=1 Tax=Sinorhizobium sp. 8-89 TaxID=3049089 RepID=UPI0024C26E78|nr:hypothetical protein [Sinorhizobium sp. 8-89]MDK1491196.1 hypothetical protein [Sinorhizobium sp. 8-89]